MRKQCEASDFETFEYCDDLLSILEDNRPNIKGIVEIKQFEDARTLRANYIVAKQGDYRYKGLAFNFCPYCGKPVRAKPSELLKTGIN